MTSGPWSNPAVAPSVGAVPAAGWYPDPVSRGQSRYWDGREWTASVARGGAVGYQPITPDAARQAWADHQRRRATTSAAPGWYPDPVAPGQSRQWDGRTWTGGVARDGRIGEQAISPEAAQRAWDQEQRAGHRAPGGGKRAAPRAGAGQAARPGWYPDPGVRQQLRYWDGLGWTAGVARDGHIGAQLITPEARHRVWAARQDRRAAWPARSVFIGVAGALVASALAVLAKWPAEAAAGENSIFVAVASQAGLWTGLLLTCALVSRRYGTSRFREDYAVSFQGADVGRGIALSAAARLVSIAVVAPIVILLGLDSEENLQGFDDLASGPAGMAVFLVILLVGAPLVEEVFFRGLLQRSLEERLGPVAAIGTQAALFGLAHVSTALGVANLVIFAGTAAGGVILGAAAWHYHRLGPSIVAHSLFNLLPAIMVLVGAS